MKPPKMTIQEALSILDIDRLVEAWNILKEHAEKSQWNWLPPEIKDEGWYDLKLFDGQELEKYQYWAFNDLFFRGGYAQHPPRVVPDGFQVVDGRDVQAWRLNKTIKTT